MLVGLVCWCLSLAGLTPPATLSVVEGLNNETISVSWDLPDWDSLNFVIDENIAAKPSPEVLRIATLTAESMAIVPLAPPAANSSFNVQFFGPTLQCSIANSTQQQGFDLYQSLLANDTLMGVVKSTFESHNLTWSDNALGDTSPAPLMIVYSAFSPMSGQRGWLSTYNDENEQSKIDEFNNWLVKPVSYNPGSILNPSWSIPPDDLVFTTQQLWVQTADQSIVCIQNNASFEVELEFVNSVQTTANYKISKAEPFWVPLTSDYEDPEDDSNAFFNPSSTYWNQFNSYVVTYLAISSFLNGNVSTTLMPPNSSAALYEKSGQTYDGNVTIYDKSSKIFQTGLIACDEFVNGYWNGDNAIGSGDEGPAAWQNSTSKYYWDTSASDLGWLRTSERFQNISNNLFTEPSWMCRNRTLLRAIEDLANNITISLLSSKSLTKPNATTIMVNTFTTQNIYQYDSFSLILSYSIATFFTLICASVGFFALRFNGVAHSTDFSAIIATTRNRELDEVSRGHSLGALPLAHTSMKLQFGAFMDDGEKGHPSGGGSGAVHTTARHIGFGDPGKVVKLRKWGTYV